MPEEIATRPAPVTVSRIGFWAAVTTTVLTVVAFGIAVATPPRSGPSCTFDTCVTYPYTDIAAYFPRDYLWMVPATLVPFAFVVLLACVHDSATDGWKPVTLAGLAVAAMAAAILAVDYVVQLTVIQPSVALLAIAGAVPGQHGVARAVRWVCVAAFTLTVLALVGTAAIYGTDVEYRFEVMVITINWTALIVAGVLLAILFRRDIRDRNRTMTS